MELGSASANKSNLATSTTLTDPLDTAWWTHKVVATESELFLDAIELDDADSKLQFPHDRAGRDSME